MADLFFFSFSLFFTFSSFAPPNKSEEEEEDSPKMGVDRGEGADEEEGVRWELMMVSKEGESE
jgi:hypothetical protein